MPAFDINAACSGFVYGLALADSMIRSRTLSNVLVVASEALTPLVDYTDRSTCVLFGDGAAAAVVGSGGGEGGIRAVRWAADGAESDLIYHGAREEDPMRSRAIRMSGRGTFRFAVERLSEAATQLCDAAGWNPDDVDWFIPHQANLRIIEATAKRLGVSMDRVILNVERVGNTSAASIPLAIHEAAAAGRLEAGQKIISVAFGSGVTWGGIALGGPAARGDGSGTTPRDRWRRPGPKLRPVAPVGTVECRGCGRRFGEARFEKHLACLSRLRPPRRGARCSSAPTSWRIPGTMERRPGCTSRDRDPLGFDDGVPYPSRVAGGA